VKWNISQFVHNISKICFKSHDMQLQRNILANVQCLLLACALQQSCNCLISEALLVADHVSVRCCFSSWRPSHWFLINMFLHVGFSRCLQALVHWSGFHASSWKWMVHIAVMSCCSNSCCQTSVNLLVTFAFQCIMRVQEHWAAVTQDFGLHTRHGIPTDQTWVL